MSARLLWIEMRRNERLWLFPLVTAAYGLWVASFFDLPAMFWTESSIMVRNAVAVLAPVTAAVGAWVASREHRRGMEDLVASTSRPTIERTLTMLGATALIGSASYAVVATLVLGWTAMWASWGRPYPTVMLPSLMAIFAAACLGFALGRAIRIRVAPILAAAGMSAALSLPISLTNAWPQLLSPVDSLEESPWYGVWPNVGLAQSLFLLGLAGIGIAVVARTSGAKRFAVPVLAGAIALVVVGVAAVRDATIPRKAPAVIPYELVCRGEPVVVCVHPAYEAVLDDLTNRTNTMVAALNGLDGAPRRFEQFEPFAYPRPEAAGFHLSGVSDLDIGSTVSSIAMDLLRGPDVPPPSGPPTTTDLTTVVQFWLLDVAGFDMTCNGGMARYTVDSSGFGFFVNCAAAERFSALDPAVRRAWLREHYADLRAGRVTLDDLP